MAVATKNMVIAMVQKFELRCCDFLRYSQSAVSAIQQEADEIQNGQRLCRFAWPASIVGERSRCILASDMTSATREMIAPVRISPNAVFECDDELSLLDTKLII